MKRLLIKKEDVVPSDGRFRVIGVFNPAVTKYKDKTLLLLRVAETPTQEDDKDYVVPLQENGKIILKPLKRQDYDFSDPRVVISKTAGEKSYLTSISHLRLAESADGINFEIADKPTILPYGPYEEYGLEDSHITEIEGTYYITHSCASRFGILTGLITTTDFKSFDRQGYLFHPDNKDVVIFPQKIKGLYYALHRPSISHFGKLGIWLASSPDLLHFGNHSHLYDPSEEGFDSHRVGASCVPFETDKGFVEIYHGATKDNIYCLGAMLLDKDTLKIKAITKSPLVSPTEDYEKKGFFPNVVFSCGCVVEKQNVIIYYGAADESVASITLKLEDIFNAMEVIQ